MTQPTQGALSFQGLGISPNFLAVLTAANFTSPTPIQHQSIPTAIEGKDLIGIAQTGTGKTLAFGIPMIQRLAANKGQGLILLPTRELALQVNDTLNKIGTPLGLRTVVVIGGEAMGRQTKLLNAQPHIIVATPGRLNDHLKQGTLKLNNIKVLVLDEADRMFDMGFAPQIAIIMKLIPKDRQTLLFSATMPPEIAKIASTHMAMPVRIEVAPQGTSAANVEQEIFILYKNDKIRLLQKILTDYKGTVLIFSRTKHGAKRIMQQIQKFGHTAAELHSNKSLAQRIKALDGFKTGKFRVLVATDIAARGIDVKNIELVINFDLPDNSEDYVHRIGRTGRNGSSGKAISFATPDQKGDIQSIERLIKKTLPVSKVPNDLPPGPAPETMRTLPPSQNGGNYRQRGFQKNRPSGQRHSDRQSQNKNQSQGQVQNPQARNFRPSRPAGQGQNQGQPQRSQSHHPTKRRW